MFGVVLWSDAEDGKAVFWCEDQGDLAYFETSNGPIVDDMPFDAGDMVQFDVSVEQRLRRASNARLVQGKAYSGLPEQLRQNAHDDLEKTQGIAKVIPLRPYLQPDAQRRARPKRKA
jgi:hypothetical protein